MNLKSIQFRKIHMKPLWVAWLLLFFLNFILFLPAFVADLGFSQFFPISILTDGSVYERLKLVFNRANLDPFRIAPDYFIILGVLYLFRAKISVRLSAWKMV